MVVPHGESAVQLSMPPSASSLKEKPLPKSIDILPVGATVSRIIESLAGAVDSLPA